MEDLLLLLSLLGFLFYFLYMAIQFKMTVIIQSISNQKILLLFCYKKIFMYKVLIKSATINHHRETPLRRIIFQEQKNHESLPQLTQQSQSTHCMINKFQAKYYLFTQASLKSDLKSSQVQSNINLNKTGLKSQVILIIGLQTKQLNEILDQILQRQQHIDLIQHIHDENVQNVQIKQRNMIVLIYFKNMLVCQEIYDLINNNFHIMPLYLKEVVIIENKSQNINGIRMNKIANREQNLSKVGEEQKIWIQLPLCLKCLQRLESNVTGIPSSIFLNKTLDTNMRCQTCMTIQRKRVLHEQTHCADCKSFQDNWICLVCSKIGCGRYINADAYKHFKEQNHILTMDLSTERVWNYLSDCFSHSFLPLQKHEATLKFPQFSHTNNDKKYEQSLQGAFWEYCSVVSEQLQRQRLFYEKQMLQQDQKFMKQKLKMESKLLQLQKQISQKQLSCKRDNKKLKKNSKKLQELKQKCILDRQILTNYQKMAKQQGKQVISMKQIEENSQKIKQKKRILDSLDQQISNIIVKLTE